MKGSQTEQDPLGMCLDLEKRMLLVFNHKNNNCTLRGIISERHHMSELPPR